MKTKTVRRRASDSQRRPAKLWQLRLYVMGQTPKSLMVFSNLKKICETHLKGRYRIMVIDLVKQPELARDNQIVATPTLIKEFPSPVRRFIGSLLNTTSLFSELDVIEKGKIA